VWRIAWSALGPGRRTACSRSIAASISLLQLNLVLAIYLITIFVFEVPTGAIADVFGRRPRSC
jgi:MFS family permease